jgi:hypothetical protein
VTRLDALVKQAYEPCLRSFTEQEVAKWQAIYAVLLPTAKQKPLLTRSYGKAIVVCRCHD